MAAETLSRRSPWRLALLIVALGVAGALFWRLAGPHRVKTSPVIIEVVLPDQYRGFVYLFFDSEQAPLQPSAPGVYSLLVPPSGRLRAGQYPGQSYPAKNVRFAFRYLNNERPPVVPESVSPGGVEEEGGSVIWVRPFVGDEREHQAALPKSQDERAVLDEMRRQAALPAKRETPASLRGIERIPLP